jgi:predicted ATPase
MTLAIRSPVRGDDPEERAENNRSRFRSLPGNVFVGRAAECARIAALLGNHDTRLITLTGPGGVGKTRLALETVRNHRHHYHDGTTVLELASVDQAHGIVPAIASALSIFDDVAQLPGRLREELSDRHLLLVLDNLEHLLPDATETLAWLLETVPKIELLVTSRRATQLPGESLVGVTPLGIERGSHLAGGASGDAVELFIVRAQRLYDRFQPTASDRETIADLCQRVDGLPLAIELLASWADIYTPSEILERYSLHTTSRHSIDDPRHRTMSQAISWSYELLSPEEQALFRRLAVFTGGFQREMVERIAAGREAGAGNRFGEGFGCHGHPEAETIGFDPTAPEYDRQDPELTIPLPPILGDPLRHLATLLDHQLVLRDEGADGHPRFTMLATVREFGLTLLDRTGEDQAVRHAHAWIITTFAEATAYWAWANQSRPWGWSRIDDEVPNLRAALRWVLAQPTPNAELALRLAEAPWGYFQLRGLVSEVRRWLEAALALPNAPVWIRAIALANYGLLSWMQNDLDTATEAAESALAIARTRNWHHISSNAYSYLALIEWRKEDRDPARIILFLMQARTAFARLGHGHNLGLGVLDALEGVVASMAGDPEAAEELFEDAYSHLEAASFEWGMATVRFVSAENDRGRGRIIPAARQLIDAIRRYDALREPWGCGVITYAAGCLAADRGKLATAARFFGAARMLLDRTGNFVPPADIGAYEETAARVRSLLGDEAFTELAEAGSELSTNEIVSEVIEMLEATGEEERPRRQRRKAPTKLTRNQLEVVHLLIQGKDVEQIAAARGQYPQNIYQILNRICERWELDDWPEIAPFALQNGIFTSDGHLNAT